jgi:lipopolysaccharide export system protein LptA
MFRACVLLLGITLAAAAPASAQNVVCNVIERQGGSATISNAGLPTEYGIIYRAHFVCDGGQRTIMADTATYSRASGQIELFGRAEIRDPERILTAARATYFTQIRQLSARGNVVVTDRSTGSVIEGDVLTFLEETPERPESQITATATTGQARATLLRERSGEPGVQDTTVVDASQIDVMGDRLFRGLGDAVMTRDSLRATGFMIEYEQEAGTLVVNGNGVIEVPNYELRGDSITASVTEGEQIRDVFARHNTSLHSEDLQVRAPALRLFFEDGEVSRMVAQPWEAPQFAPPWPRPTAQNDQFRMEADSIDVLAPGQRLEEAVATGTARVERLTPDSLRMLLPEVEAEVLALIEHDWVDGDTVRAYFTDGPPRARSVEERLADPDAAAAEDEVAPERVLERLWAAGEPARTMHRTRDENAGPDVKFSIAYLVGREIDVTFTGGAVAVVTASEDVRGVYLQPTEVAQRTRTGTTETAAPTPPRQRP